jgi:hypothetical protein
MIWKVSGPGNDVVTFFTEAKFPREKRISVTA